MIEQQEYEEEENRKLIEKFKNTEKMYKGDKIKDLDSLLDLGIVKKLKQNNGSATLVN